MTQEMLIALEEFIEAKTEQLLIERNLIHASAGLHLKRCNDTLKKREALWKLISPV